MSGKKGRPRKKNFSVSAENGKKYNYVRVTAVIDGKQRQFTGKTREEAEEKRDRARKESDVLYGKTTFGEWAEIWIEKIYVPTTKNSPNTQRLYINAWNRHLKPTALYRMPLLDVTSVIVQDTLTNLDCPESTKKKIFNLLRKFYAYLDTENMCKNIMSSLSPPSPDEKLDAEIITWTDDELEAILHLGESPRTEHKIKALVWVAAKTGMRISEILALRMSDIERNGKDEDGNPRFLINVTKQLNYKYPGFEIANVKTKTSRRQIPVDFMTRGMLAWTHMFQKEELEEKGFKNPEGYIFLTSTGSFMDRHNLARSLERYYKRIGVPNKSIHTYRRTFATQLCEQGVPIDVVSRLLGHSDVSVTAKYYVKRETTKTAQMLEDLGILKNIF